MQSRGAGCPAGPSSPHSPAPAAASAAVPTSWWLNFIRYLSVIKKQQHFGSHYKNASLDCIPQGLLLQWNIGRCHRCDHGGLFPFLKPKDYLLNCSAKTTTSIQTHRLHLDWLWVRTAGLQAVPLQPGLCQHIWSQGALRCKH